jgi:serine/threonine protein kinase
MRSTPHISEGIVRRDIKPAKIITKRGTAKVLDFGLDVRGERHQSRQHRRDHLLHVARAGTRQGARPAQRSVFLGIMLYEMSIGHMPFGGNTSTLVFDAILHKAARWSS